MRTLRFLLMAFLLSLAMQACSSPTVPRYPNPDNTAPPKRPPNQGFSPTQP